VANLQQERHIELVSGTEERFVITSRMTGAGVPAELPHLNVFVLKVVARNDAKKDTLVRVARVSDLSLLPVGRDHALTAPGEYLAAGMALGYATLTEALLAQTAIKDRVNQLIQDWMSFATKFNAPDPTPANISLPTSELPQKAALIQAYRLAKQDRYQKQLAKEAADGALARAQAAFAAAQDLVAPEALVSSATATQTAFADARFAYDALRAAGGTFVAAAGCVAEPDRDVFAGALNAAVNDSSVIQGQVLAAGGLVGVLAAFLTTRAAERDVARAAVSAAIVDQAARAQTFVSAETLEASALAAVLAICPDFDATSACLVAG